MHMKQYYDGDAWRFYADGKGLWQWTRIAAEDGAVVGRSHRGFADKYACFANAKRHGYGFPGWRDETDQETKAAAPASPE